MARYEGMCETGSGVGGGFVPGALDGSIHRQSIRPMSPPSQLPAFEQARIVIPGSTTQHHASEAWSGQDPILRDRIGNSI